MVLVLTRCALTPISAKSTGPSRLSSEPMEDPNSSGTRKRPRLDSGDRAYRSMSADRLTATPTHSRLSKAPTTPPNGILSSQSPRKIDDCAPVSHTPSKVTINVREPVENSSPARISPQINGTASLRGGDGGDYLPNSAKDSSNKHDCSSSNVISVTSSPTNSPEIEVAEVEDMNDESGETRWKPLTSATSMLEAKTVQDTLLLSFPFLGERGRSLRKTLAILAQTLEKSKSQVCPFYPCYS